MTLANKGNRTFEFADGTVIKGNFNKEIYGGVFMGSLRSEATGGFTMKDEKNNVSCEIKYGKTKKKYFVFNADRLTISKGQLPKTGKK